MSGKGRVSPRCGEASGVDGVVPRPPVPAQQRLGSPRMGLFRVKVLPDKGNTRRGEGSDDGGDVAAGREGGEKKKAEHSG